MIVDTVTASLGLKAVISLADPLISAAIGTKILEGLLSAPQLSVSIWCVTYGFARWRPGHDSVALMFLLSIWLENGVFLYSSLELCLVDLVALPQPRPELRCRRLRSLKFERVLNMNAYLRMFLAHLVVVAQEIGSYQKNRTERQPRGSLPTVCFSPRPSTRRSLRSCGIFGRAFPSSPVGELVVLTAGRSGWFLSQVRSCGARTEPTYS